MRKDTGFSNLDNLLCNYVAHLGRLGPRSRAADVSTGSIAGKGVDQENSAPGGSGGSDSMAREVKQHGRQEAAFTQDYIELPLGSSFD